MQQEIGQQKTKPEKRLRFVDNHKMVRRGTSSYLEAQPDISLVAQAGSGTEAVRLVQEFIPDVVLMDLVMPDMAGVEATRRVKNIRPRTHVVILTSFHQDEYAFQALQDKVEYLDGKTGTVRLELEKDGEAWKVHSSSLE